MKDYGYIKTWEELLWLKDMLMSEPQWVFDIEGTSLDFAKDTIIGIGFTWKREQARYLPLQVYKPIVGFRPFWGEKQQDVLKILKLILENDSEKIAHNGKHDFKTIFHNLNITVSNFNLDTILLYSTLFPGKKRYGLGALSELYPDLTGYKEDTEDIELHKLSMDKLVIYNNKDTDLTYRIAEDYSPQLMKNQKLLEYFTTIKMPLMELASEMEYFGYRIDTEHSLKLHLELIESLNKLKQEINETTKSNINILSSDQVGDLLFNKLKLPIGKKTDGGKPSTRKDDLQKLLEKTNNPVLKLIMTYRATAANKTAMVDAFIPKMKRKDNKEKDYVLDKEGYFHGNFKLWFTNTGRLSSGREEGMEDTKSLNLQNIPRDKRFRNQFLPDKGHLMLCADYAQLELRVLADLCKDPTFLKAFREDYDPHSLVGSFMAGVSYEEVLEGYKTESSKIIRNGMTAKDIRNLSKNIGFGWVYLAADGKFAYLFPGKNDQERIKNEKDAKDRYFATFNRIIPFRNEVIRAARKSGFIQTLSGSIVNLPDINNNIESLKNHAERQAVNGIIQGPSSDLTCKSAIDIRKHIIANDIPARVINLVHDAIYISVEEFYVSTLYETMKSLMEASKFGMKVKMKADIKITDRWDGKDITSKFIS